MRGFAQPRTGRSGEDGSVGRVLFVTAAVFTVGFCIWCVSERVGRNDYLLREARFLAAAYQRWQQQIAANTPPELISYTVNNRHGTIVLINEEVIVDGQKQVAVLGWTNSCLGPGTLIITSSNVFLWREPNGVTRKLNIPDFCRVPWWWYFTPP